MKRLAAVLVILAFAGAFYQLRVWRGRVADAGLVVDSMQVAVDVAREVTALAHRQLGDSTRAWQRRTEQHALEQDALERQLRIEARARVSAEARVRALQDSATAPVTVGAGDVRSARWTIHQPPFQVEASAELPPPPARGTLQVNVALDPLPLTVRLGCRDGAVVPQAWAVVTGPEWATLELGTVEQVPGICGGVVALPSYRVPAWAPAVAGALGAFSARRNVLDGLVGATVGWGFGRLVGVR